MFKHTHTFTNFKSDMSISKIKIEFQLTGQFPSMWSKRLCCSSSRESELGSEAASLTVSSRANSKICFPLKNSLKSFPSRLLRPQRRTIPQCAVVPSKTPHCSPASPAKLPFVVNALRAQRGCPPQSCSHAGQPVGAPACGCPLQAQRDQSFIKAQKRHSPASCAPPESLWEGKVTSEGSHHRGLQRADR